MCFKVQYSYTIFWAWISFCHHTDTTVRVYYETKDGSVMYIVVNVTLGKRLHTYLVYISDVSDIRIDFETFNIMAAAATTEDGGGRCDDGLTFTVGTL